MSEKPTHHPTAQRLSFSDQTASLNADQVWEYDAATDQQCADTVAATIRALRAPDDFPSIDAAIVDGDHVVLAVDPNVPDVDQVIAGTLETLRETTAGLIEIVVWDEASESTLNRIRAVCGDFAVVLHRGEDRESLSYLAADVDAEPIYLNRNLVDADFVLPIVAIRPTNLSQRRDLSGVFPALCDSASRSRFSNKICQGIASAPAMKSGNTIAEEVPWLLGVQLILSVTTNAEGAAGEIHAGTVESMAKRITPVLRVPDPIPPPAELVIASLDGDRQQQTWNNVARAAEAAMAYAQPDATIVVWSALDEPPTGTLLAMDVDEYDREDFDGPPNPDRFSEVTRTLQRVIEQHRLMLHSKLPREIIEPLGIGVIDTPSELANLSHNFASCGVLRAASFAGGN